MGKKYYSDGANPKMDRPIAENEDATSAVNIDCIIADPSVQNEWGRITMRVNGVLRWHAGKDPLVEPGSLNQGSDYVIQRFSDAGAIIDTPFIITRQTGIVKMAQGIQIGSSTPPSTPTSSGAQGAIRWDSTHFYVCVATNTWRRASLSTW